MPLTKASDVEAQSRPNEGNGLPNILYSQPWWHGLSSNDTSQEIAVGCAAKASDGHLFTDTYHLEVNVEQASRADAENEAHGTMASGDVVQNGRQAEQQVKKVPTAMPAQEHPQSSSHSQMEHVGYSTVRSSYPFQDPSYGGVMAPYATQINPHLYAMHQRVPLPLPLEEEPVYVNAKQYHGILRRRQSRARAELEKKAIKSRKPYLHESRHQHALRRPRGSGGRFLNTKKLNSDSADSASRENPNPNLTLPTTFSGAMDTKSTVDSHEGNSSSCNQHEAKGSSISKLHNAATRLNNNGSGYNLGSAYHSSSMNSENIDSYGQGGMKVNVTSSGAVSVI